MRTGDKGRGKDGEPLGNFEPGTDVTAQATVLAEGCWGHLTGAAIREFDLAEDREPQVWELGVKEVWKVPKPLDRLIHTIGPWPLKLSSKYGQIGGTWIYPMKDEKTGDDLVSIGFVVDLEYADATTSAHDLLQLFKTASARAQDPRGRRARRLGRQGAAGRRLLVDAQAHDAGRAAGRRLGAAWSTRWRSRASTTASSRASSPAEAIYEQLKRGGSDFSSYEQAVEDSSIGKELYEVRNTRQPFQKGFLQGGPLVNVMIATKGKLPRRSLAVAPQRREADVHRRHEGLAIPSRTASTRSTSCRRSTSRATRPATTRPNHIRVQKDVPREVAETWRWMCPAGVYEIPEDAPEHGNVDVIVNYTNCVQCGAITAKGGRLTTPEGGDGPLYTQT